MHSLQERKAICLARKGGYTVLLKDLLQGKQAQVITAVQAVQEAFEVLAANGPQSGAKVVVAGTSLGSQSR